jgi:hypothetical protein
VPVAGEFPAVKVRVVVVEPPVGTVTGLGRLTLTPAGAVPSHEAARLTSPLNPLMEERVTVEYFVASGVRLIVEGVGREAKSGVTTDDASKLPLGLTIT